MSFEDFEKEEQRSTELLIKELGQKANFKIENEKNRSISNLGPIFFK